MSPGVRAFFGAVFGALLTLALHPASRPFVTGAASRVPPEAFLELEPTPTTRLAAPRDLLGASLWIQTGLDRLATSRNGLRPEELRTLVNVADAAIERERQNAFWHQARAIFLLQLGRREDAEKAWERASVADAWKDYQTERLLAKQALLESSTGAQQAWQFALVYYQRVQDVGAVIERGARELLARADLKTLHGLRIRYFTLVNGDLLRTGGRSITISSHGANTVELAAYPVEQTGNPSPKRLWLGQTELLRRLNEEGMKDEAERAAEVFRENDAWRALVLHDEAQQLPNRLSLLSVFVAEAPLALIVVTCAGALAWLLGVGVHRFWGEQRMFPVPVVAVAAVLGAAGVYLLSGNVAASLATALSVSFLLVAPNQARTLRPNDLGPLFTFVLLVLALASAVALTTYVVASSGPAVALSPVLGVPHDYYERPALAGLATVFLSLTFLACPLWALVHRVSTPYVVGVGLRRIGAMLALGALLATVALSPLCVYLDRQCADTLGQLVGNEPVYHLVQ